jgi:hypothetical protein
MATGKTARIDASASDSAIDGLGGGLLAGLAMGSFLVLISWPTGVEPAQLLNHFDLQAIPSPLVGGLIHLAVSGVYGIAYGLSFWLLLRHALAGKPTWAGALAGIAYGLLLWLPADLVLLPATSPSLQVVPGWAFAAAHMLYGAILDGWVLNIAIHHQADRIP